MLCMPTNHLQPFSYHYEHGRVRLFRDLFSREKKKLAQLRICVLNIYGISSDSQINKPQHGHPKRAELLDVNINTGVKTIILRASLI